MRNQRNSSQHYSVYTQISHFKSAQQAKFTTYPENLSRIILTLTCSPIWNHKLRMKFSSIQGSNSPILERSIPSALHSPRNRTPANIPEGGFPFVRRRHRRHCGALLVRVRTAEGSRSGTRTGLALTGHLGIGGGGRAGSTRSTGGARATRGGGTSRSAITLVLVGERVEVLERHIHGRIDRQMRKHPRSRRKMKPG